MWRAFREERDRAQSMLHRSNEVMRLVDQALADANLEWWQPSLRLALETAIQLNQAAAEQVGRMACVDPEYIPF